MITRFINANALSVVTNQSLVHNGDANQWSVACPFGEVAEGFRVFVPLEKGDHRGSSVVKSRPPAAKKRGVPLGKGDKGALESPSQQM